MAELRSIRLATRVLAVVMVACCRVAAPAFGAELPFPLDYEMDADDKLAQQLNNPVADLISVPLQNNFEFGGGRDDNAFRYSLVAQPVVPFHLNADWNLITRTIIPFAHLDGVFPNTESGLGDILQAFWFSPSRPTSWGLTWGVGPAALYPTATNQLIGADQWGAGPTAVGVLTKGPFLALLLANHVWGVGDVPADQARVNQSFIQSALAYTSPQRTTYFVGTESFYSATFGRWTIPLQIGVNQLLRIGSQPFQLGGLVRYYAEVPTGGPKWGFQLRLTLVFPK